MSEDLSEGEKGDTLGDMSAHGDSNRSRLPRISSVDAMETWASFQKGKKLYIVLIRHELNFSALNRTCNHMKSGNDHFCCQFITVEMLINNC